MDQSKIRIQEDSNMKQRRINAQEDDAMEQNHSNQGNYLKFFLMIGTLLLVSMSSL